MKAELEYKYKRKQHTAYYEGEDVRLMKALDNSLYSLYIDGKIMFHIDPKIFISFRIV